jgi:hypothetical protein
MPARGRLALAAVLLAAAACQPAGPIAWDDPRPLPRGPIDTERLTIGSDGGPAWTAPGLAPPTGVPACPGSVSVADAGSGVRYAVWWQVRPDSGAVLWSSRTATAGATWSAPVAVDTADRSGLGCSRPPPSVAAMTGDAALHVAYWMQAPEGPGVFYAHSMEHGAMFHAPVAIVYGERPSRTSVAASGDTVVVAYEDPNSARPQIALALSRLAGHIYEERTPVSGDLGPAVEPRVALRGRRVAVAWTALGAAGDRSPAVRRPLLRLGTLR